MIVIGGSILVGKNATVITRLTMVIIVIIWQSKVKYLAALHQP